MNDEARLALWAAIGLAAHRVIDRHRQQDPACRARYLRLPKDGTRKAQFV